VSTDVKKLTAAVENGKRIWENTPASTATPLGEGAYFAPELGNVWMRYGGDKDPKGARETLIKAWMADSLPRASRAAGRCRSST
jgi:nitric oxide reductase subunit C